MLLQQRDDDSMQSLKLTHHWRKGSNTHQKMTWHVPCICVLRCLKLSMRLAAHPACQFQGAVTRGSVNWPHNLQSPHTLLKVLSMQKGTTQYDCLLLGALLPNPALTFMWPSVVQYSCRPFPPNQY